ncbi:MAG: (2Fe-2S) ferredoxin domain-containing protein [Casimicrobiaceae bacterium]|nr:(2Fe-2S) ferredoxin domain-containing protein [Casimicrobiaceae bacterium]MCX8098922.1 (2Fe-2S) ferredoxin domain-containing protein [Casimicrobiaceae bacterium]MDW8312620.1 (2Fe-2S) ferredoxin domain-containing protein [Burkholderiales bacterium]
MSYYRYHVFFCTNERDDGRPSCGARCSAELRDYAKAQVKALGLAGKGQVRVNMSGCLDRCDEGPTVVVYPEGVWYRISSREEVDELIREHLQQGRIVERLRI